MADDSDMSEAVDAIFDPTKFAEIQIIVRLPGPFFASGEAKEFSLSQLIMPEDVGIEPAVVPEVVRRVAHILIGAMKFR